MQFSELAAKIAPASVATRGEPREAYFGPKYGPLKVAIYRREDITEKKARTPDNRGTRHDRGGTAAMVG